MTQPRTADQYDEAQRREWRTYRARVPINYYGTRAYNVGEPVPVSAVEGDAAWIPDDLVERVDGDAQTYAGSPTVVEPGPPTIDETTTAAPAASSPAPTTTEG